MREAQNRKRALAVRLIEAKSRKPFGEVIERRRAAGESFRQIGAAYGVSRMTIWRHWKEHQEREGREAVAA